MPQLIKGLLLSLTWNPQGGKREVTAINCSLNFICAF